MSRACSERRGATLPEMLVYSAVFVLILGAIYASLRMGLEAYRKSESFATLQQQAMAALRQVSDELASSPAGSTRIEPGSVVLLSAREPSGRVAYDGTGKPLWRAWVLFGVEPVDGRLSLVRREKGFTPVAEPPEPVPTAASLRSDPTCSHRTVARDIVTLDITGGSAASLRLVATTEDYGGSSVQFLDRVQFRP